MKLVANRVDHGCVWGMCANWLRLPEVATHPCVRVCNNCSCRVPLQHLEVCFVLRAARPAAESVEDEVQAALAAEAAQLKDVSTQLHACMGAAAQQIAHLNSVSAALLQHIADKDAALSLEEKGALMDGRKLPAVPRTPTVLSVSVVKPVVNSPHTSCLLPPRWHGVGPLWLAPTWLPVPAILQIARPRVVPN